MDVLFQHTPKARCCEVLLPLTVPTVANRVAQTVIRNQVEKLVDPYFHPADSYAYRRGKSALDAIEVTRRRCWQYDWVLMFNLYLHYAFDNWMTRNHPQVRFVRYADDGLLHCRSEVEAVYLQKVIGERLRSCGLELHPNKTKIVYCRDANRNGRYPNIQFEFLGYTFRGRLAKSKHGKYFNSFSPAVSRASAISVRKRMRSWTLSRWTNADLDDIADKVNASLRGWWNYYGAFFPSAFKRVLSHLNAILVKWAVRKYRRFKGSQSKAKKWLRGISEREPDVLFHWQLGVKPAVGQ
jgi:RNA-directed DNA polymerase